MAKKKKKHGGGGAAKGKKKGGILGLVKQVTSARAKHERRRAREEAESRARAAKKERRSLERARMPYKRSLRTLLVGEGDFSFAAALTDLFGEGAAENLVCTAYDSEEEARRKYDKTLDANLEKLRARAAVPLFGVDARRLHEERGWTDDWEAEGRAETEREHREWKGGKVEDESQQEAEEEGDNPRTGGRFDLVVWNFPHAGAGSVAERGVEEHQELLSLFFASAKHVLQPDGEIHITLRPGEPYTLWKVPRLAFLQGFRIKSEWDFHAAVYPGYEHRRTNGGGLSVRGAHTHCFCHADWRPPSAELETEVALTAT